MNDGFVLRVPTRILVCLAATFLSTHVLAASVSAKTVTTPERVRERLLALDEGMDLGIDWFDEFEFADADTSRAVNYGDTEWIVFENSRPALGFEFAMANAMPEGVWYEEAMSGWSNRVIHSFEVSARNKLWLQAFRAGITISYKYGGQFGANKEKFLGSVVVVPHDQSNLIGYSLDVSVCGITGGMEHSKTPAYAFMTIPLCFEVSRLGSRQTFLYYFRIEGKSSKITHHKAY